MGLATDAQGLPVTGESASVAVLDGVIHDFYAWTGDILGDLNRAASEDPGFALGHVATAIILMLGGFRGDHPAVTGAIASAAGQDGSMTPRERGHVVIAEALARGELRDAARSCQAVLLDHPTDALALRYATDLFYYLGDSSGIRDIVASVLPQWREDDPIFGFVLGRYAFGLEESGALGEAEVFGRRALAINPEDAWATHAIAHVFEASGRAEDGRHFLEETRGDWSVGEWLAIHNGWHLALFLIEAGQGDEVLGHYDCFVHPRLKENFVLDLIDASSLLWRLELAGIDVGARWSEVARIAAARIGEHVLAFNDLHVALALVGAKNREAIVRLMESIDLFLGTGKGDNLTITADVGRPLIAGMAAFGEGNWRGTIDTLLPIRHAVVRIGGSHAQRELVDQTLVAAAVRSEDWKLARALLAERVARNPAGRQWTLYRRVLAQLGDTGAWVQARRVFDADRP